MNQSLADEIEVAVIDAAVEHNPGVNPLSQTLSRRERIVYDVIERRIAAQNRHAALSGLTERDIGRIKRIVHDPDHGA